MNACLFQYLITLVVVVIINAFPSRLNGVKDLEDRLTKRVLNIRKENSVNNELRYAAFGTSVTWGATLENRSESAYPWLLSRDATNYAIRASDASYPSICTQTMIEDSIYDVIIIEYDKRSLEYTETLGKRLRQRFPDATIIFTVTWHLTDVVIKGKDDFEAGLPYWLKKSRIPGVTQEAFDSILKQDVEVKLSEAVYDRAKAFHEMCHLYNIKLYEWSLDGDLRKVISENFGLFNGLAHLNEEGHQLFANGISKIVNEAGTKRSDNVGSWGSGDYCASWLETGEIPLNRLGAPSIKRDNVPMILFDKEKQKYALEFHELEPRRFVIDNTFDSPRSLFLTYMASYPADLYPKVEICRKQHCVLIDPIAGYRHPVHVQETKNITIIPPGKNVFTLTTLEQKKAPFRLVGLSITNDEFSVPNPNI